MRARYLKCRRPLDKEVLRKYPDIQVVDAKFVAGRDHLEFAIAQAEKAFKRGTNICNDPLIEPLLRASGQRQIKKALELFGINNSREVFILSEKLPSELLEDYSCVEKNADINLEKYEVLKKAYGVDEAEIAATAGKGFDEKVKTLKNIIKERIALIEAF
jgi:KEOPS complex subunit Cgi121